MSRLVVLQYDATAAARVRDALGARYQLDEVEGWGALWIHLERDGADGAVVDLYPPFGAPSFVEIGRLRRVRPPLGLVVYAEFEGREGDLFELGRRQIDDVVIAGAADVRAELRRAADRALAAAIGLRVQELVEDRLAAPAPELLRWLVEHSREAPGAADVARAFQRSPGALARTLAQRHLPPLRRLMVWARLLRAAHLLARSDRTVEQVAFAVGYVSAASLARAFQRETGRSPAEISTRGGVAWVIETFLRRYGSRSGW